MAASYVLIEVSPDPWNARLEDLESRLAFTVTMVPVYFAAAVVLYLTGESEVEENPNLIMKITREAPWAQQHPDIMGPSNSYLYFGPLRTPGYLVYGNSPSQSMNASRRQKKGSSTSRYFLAQNGKEYKWRLTPQRCECVDSKGALVAVWETAQLEDVFHARITIKHAGLPVVTEIMTTLMLNRIARALNW